MRLSPGLALSSVLLLLAIPGLAFAQTPCDSLELTVKVTFPNDPGYEGLYKYSIQGAWDVGGFGLSHLDVFLQLEECQCKCQPGIVQFTTVAGQSSGVMEGTPDSCTVYFSGEYLCEGDPSISEEFAGPTVKFDAEDAGACEAGVMGSGSWWFYSALPPGSSQTYAGRAAIKHGQDICVGDVVGQLPICQCPTAVESKTWGGVKSIYR